MQNSLTTKIISSTGWLSIALGLTQLINFGCVILAARYLVPAEYGAYSTGMIIVAFTSIVARFGILEALVQNQPADDRQASTAAALSFLFSLAGWLLTGIAGLVLSFVWQSEGLTAISLILGVSTFSYGIQSLPESVLRRDLQFRKIAIIRLCGAVVGAIVLVVSIFYSPSVWSLVFQRVAVEAAVVVMLWIAVKPVVRFKWSNTYARDVLTFGRGIGAANVIDVFGNQFDQIIVRIFWGEQGLGLYAMAKRLLANIQQFIFMPFRQVAIAVLAGFEGNVDRIASVYRRGTRTMVSVGVLGAWVLFYGIDPLIQLLFSSQWMDCIAILKIFGWVLVYDAFVVMYPAVMQAANKPHWIAWERFALALVGTIALLYLAWSGAELREAAYAVLIQSYATLPLVIYFVWRILGPRSLGAIADLVICMTIALAVYGLYSSLVGLSYFGKDLILYIFKLAVPTAITALLLVLYLRMTGGSGGKYRLL